MAEVDVSSHIGGVRSALDEVFVFSLHRLLIFGQLATTITPYPEDVAGRCMCRLQRVSGRL